MNPIHSILKKLPGVILVTFANLLIITSIFAQSSSKICYQAVIRDAANKLVVNQSIGIKISILQGSANGTVVYTETQKPMTNANGLVSIEIGGGAGFVSIDWANGPFFIETNTDIKGGSNYTITGTSQMLGVPFAFHATKAESLVHPTVEKDPVFTAWDKSSGISIKENQISDLKHFTIADETDPKFGASVAKGITQADTANWNKKQNTYSETDPDFAAWDKSTGVAISESQITNLKHFTNADEKDPKFGASVAKGITGTDTTKWNHKSNFSGSYPDLTNKPVGVSAFTNDAVYQKAADDGDTDPENELQYIYKSGNKIGISNGGFVTISETDPIYTTSQAANITATDITHLGNLSGNNTGDQNISGIATNATAIATLQGEQTTQNAAIALNTAKVGITPAQASAIVANTGKDTTGIYHTNRAALNLVSGTNTGDQNLSGLATKTALGDSTAQLRSEIPDVSGFISTETDPIYTGDSLFIKTGVRSWNSSLAKTINAADTTRWGIDADVTNELQALRLSNDTIYLSSGGFVKLPAATVSTSLDDAYNSGSSITADAGPVTIAGTDGLVSTGTFGDGTGLSLSGEGTRMIWYPKKAAFRVGFVSGTQWDEANIGSYSNAFGNDSRASGIYSCAFGYQSIANGAYSFACGDNVTALGVRSIALGCFSNAQGPYSFAVGYSTVTGPSATCATALGRETNASATYSTAIGYQSVSSGIYSIAGGNTSTASGLSSIALGDHANASANYSIALGRNVTASTQYAIAMGNTTTASGDNSTAFGNQTTAVGKYSLAVGYGCTSNAYTSTAVGSYNVIEGTPGSWIATDPIFAVGNGTSSSSLSNAVTVYKDGTMKLKSNFYPELPAATIGTSGNKWNTVFATNGTINTSDLRLKDNITELTYGLAELLKLKPVSFFWKKSPQEGKKLGFIAQDVQPIINEVVIEGDDPDKTLGINYSSIIPVIVKGMQEQQQLIDNQKQQINELMEANKRLSERVEKLEVSTK
jgi:hypothetical protein